MDKIPAEALQNAQGGAGPSDEEQAKRAADEQQMRRDMLATILDVGARERLSRIAMVSQQRSQQIEGILFRMAQGGQLRNKVTEQQLIDLLDQARLLQRFYVAT
ncbi:PDCD5-related protein [Ephemerocybe angulata]|uniref:PDCD5-related protein n=1 Tax=Ephemerocybe angulata TaxID=980116 RepID=A0A8H6MHB9_9AGAR|nr:PDCD5-related protein [Tulosesus angulatus]